VVVAATFVLIAITASAQVKPEPPRQSPRGPRAPALRGDSTARQPEAQLPKIELPEFDITGDLVNGVVAGAKDEIDDESGLDPLSRQAGLGSREAGQSDQLDGKDRGAFSSFSEGLNGQARVGYGSFNTPLMDAWYGQTYPANDFLLRAGYASSDGHVTHGDYRKGFADLAVGFQMSEDAGLVAGSSLQGRLGIRGNGYRLYGSTHPAVRRTVNDLNASVGLKGLQFDDTAVETRLFLGNAWIDDSVSAHETVLGAQIAAAKAVDGFGVDGDLGFWVSSTNLPAAAANPNYSRLALSVRKEVARNIEVMGGVGFFLFRGSDTKTAGRFYPRAAIAWRADDWVTLFMRFDPSVHRTTLAGVFEENPYAVNTIGLRHSEFFNDLSFGADMDPGSSLHLHLAMEYQQAQNGIMYVDTARTGEWDLAYDGTASYYAFVAEGSFTPSESDLLSASVRVGGSRNSLTGHAIPYVAPVTVDACYEHRFPFSVTLATAARIVGIRYADPRSERRLDPFLLLDVKADYMFAPRWKAFLQVENLAGMKNQRWEGYAGLPRTAALGVSYAW
jgi:hypothetical protein